MGGQDRRRRGPTRLRDGAGAPLADHAQAGRWGGGGVLPGPRRRGGAATALEAIAGRPGADDERSHPQRMADALSTMAGRTLQVGSDLVGAQVRPHLALLVSQQTWEAICARRRELGSTTCRVRLYV